MNHSSRRKKDISIKILISLVSTIGIFVFSSILFFVFQNGASLLSWKLISSDYYSTNYDTYYDGEVPSQPFTRPNNLSSDAFFSEKWGIAFIDEVDNEGIAYVQIIYVSEDSPLRILPDKNDSTQEVTLSEYQSLEKVIFSNRTIFLSSSGAENAATMFNQSDGILDMLTSTPGKGIRGSIITTLILIGLTLVISLPIGVLTAIYLHEFAPKKWIIVSYLRRLIEMLTGIPSIVFGLMGAAVFIPFVSSLTGADGGNLISGALTLAVIVLPVIISSTEEALKTIPDDYRQASLALGATKTQTTFRVVLKSAIPGILSAVLLSIGRIIGESAALIYAVGTAIKDKIILTERSTSLAVHIWSIMAGESPNFELASAISIIILLVVFVLNIVVKIITHRLVTVGRAKI